MSVESSALNVERSSPRGAVFLSYASQDAAAARRICDALRASGVEVWFDQNELVGGDAWDAKIRKQIKECALFVPVISAATQARHEGYFRIEWRLAAQRTHAMSGAKAFLLPVVIDETRDAEAHVPGEFRDMQWTRLPGGEGMEKFCARVKQLLGGSELEPGRPRPGELGEGTASPVRTKRKSSSFWLAAAMVGVVTLAALALWQPWRGRETPASPAAPTALAAPPVQTVGAAIAVNEKSIAVLPFANLSDEKDSAYFTGGVQEDILTSLAGISELRVVSRTTAGRYRDTKKSIREIGRELGVAFVLEGSVRRSGGKVRVTGQLIDARTDEQLWAKNYDRDLSDIFAIQSELAQTIAGALKAALLPAEKAQLERKPTENLAAYELYLKGRAVILGDLGVAESLHQAADYFQKAVELDPRFIRAWAELAGAHASLVGNALDTSQKRVASADAALLAALRLAPQDAEVLLAAAQVASLVHQDRAKSSAYLEQALRLQPTNAEVHRQLSWSLNDQGLSGESLVHSRRAAELEPGNSDYVSGLASILMAARRFDEERAVLRRAQLLKPDDFSLRFNEALIIFRRSGDRGPGERLFAGLSAEERKRPEPRDYEKTWAYLSGDLDRYLEMDRTNPTQKFYTGFTESEAAAEAAIFHLAKGDRAAAMARLRDYPGQLRRQLEAEPHNDRLWSGLALMEAIQGNRAEALAALARATKEVAKLDSRIVTWILSWKTSAVHALLGDREAAVVAIRRMLGQNGYYTVHTVRVSPHFVSLRGDPGFEAMLADPKNLEPLF